MFMFPEKCAPSSVTFTYCSFRGFGLKHKTLFLVFLKNIKAEVAQIMLHTSLHFHKGEDGTGINRFHFPSPRSLSLFNCLPCFCFEQPAAHKRSFWSDVLRWPFRLCHPGARSCVLADHQPRWRLSPGTVPVL